MPFFWHGHMAWAIITVTSLFKALEGSGPCDEQVAIATLASKWDQTLLESGKMLVNYWKKTEYKIDQSPSLWIYSLNITAL